MGLTKSKLSKKMVAKIAVETGFSDEEIRHWHKGFLKDCPNGTGMGTGQSRESREFSVPGLESRDFNLPGLSHGFQSQSRLSRQISVPVPGLASHRCRDSVGFVSHGTVPAVPAKISFCANFE